eukprot:m.100514 g.100514  ORF g.100514 m.100514 type:complete len:394 (-) comp16782_c2_seq16:1253-2434(-)
MRGLNLFSGALFITSAGCSECLICNIECHIHFLDSGCVVGPQRTSKKSEPAPGPERTLAQHRAMTGSALAESNATALESPWANTPSTLAASISEFVHACFAAISNAPSLHGAPEVVDEQHSTKGIVVLRGSDHSEHVSTFDVAVQEASSKYPNVRLAFVLHDVAPEGSVWGDREDATRGTSEGSFAPARGARDGCGYVELPACSGADLGSEVWPKDSASEDGGVTWMEHLQARARMRQQQHNLLVLGLTMIECELYCSDFAELAKLPLSAEPLSARDAVDMVRMAHCDYLVTSRSVDAADTVLPWLSAANFEGVARALTDQATDGPPVEDSFPRTLTFSTAPPQHRLGGIRCRSYLHVWFTRAHESIVRECYVPVHACPSVVNMFGADFVYDI